MAGKTKIARINGENLIVHEEQILKFQKEIERIVRDDMCSYLEAISSYCEDNDVDYESVKNIISVPLMQKLMKDVHSANLVRGLVVRNTLDIEE